MTTSGSASAIVDAIEAFFAEHEVASLRLLLRLDAEDASVEERVLRVFIRGGRWHWTEYGGDTDHSEVLAVGAVEFYAPFHR